MIVFPLEQRLLLVRMQSNMASCGSGSSEIKVLADLDFVDVFPVEQRLLLIWIQCYMTS